MTKHVPRKDGVLSRNTVEVLARLPKEPGMAIMADLLDDVAAGLPVRAGIAMILTALARIRGRYGLFEGQVDVEFEGKVYGVAGYGIPSTDWERAQYAAATYLDKHSL
jgi:hypothetical protein